MDYMVETFILEDRPDSIRINELAKDGWELVSVVSGQMTSSYCARVATSFYYKRLIITIDDGVENE